MIPRSTKTFSEITKKEKATPPLSDLIYDGAPLDNIGKQMTPAKLKEMGYYVDGNTMTIRSRESLVLPTTVGLSFFNSIRITGSPVVQQNVDEPDLDYDSDLEYSDYSDYDSDEDDFYGSEFEYNHEEDDEISQDDTILTSQVQQIPSSTTDERSQPVEETIANASTSPGPMLIGRELDNEMTNFAMNIDNDNDFNNNDIDIPPASAKLQSCAGNISDSVGIGTDDRNSKLLTSGPRKRTWTMNNDQRDGRPENNEFVKRLRCEKGFGLPPCNNEIDKALFSDFISVESLNVQPDDPRCSRLHDKRMVKILNSHHFISRNNK